MGWGNCGEDSRGRPIGYYHAAQCDYPGCDAEIDRGLSYACGGMHGHETLGGDDNIDWSAMDIACEGYFCGRHQAMPCLEHEDGAELYAPTLCVTCAANLERAYREDPEMRELWPTDAGPLPASVDTHPKGGDSEAAPFMGSAVPKADAQTGSGHDH